MREQHENPSEVTPTGPNDSGAPAAGGDGYIGRDDPLEAERLSAQRVGGLEELTRALSGCALPPSPRVLEVGCGAGAFTEALLQSLPGARITAIDINADLLAEAGRRLGAVAAPGGRVRLERADATRLPYAARSCDLVACRCVLMHQAEPTVAAAEMHRVVDVGGYALAIEPDWGARALYPDAEALDALLDLARRGRPYGFPDLLIGRKLFAIFRAVGFAPVWMRPTAFAATADDIAQASAQSAATDLAAMAHGAHAGPERLLEQSRHLLRQAGLISDLELDRLIDRWAALARSQDYFSAGVDLAAVGMKQGPRLAP